MIERKRAIFAVPKLLGVLIAIAGGLVISTVTVAAGNKGDIWLNNVGTSAAPGHVPHLQFKDIAMYANYPSGSSGTYDIVAWKPTGDNKSVVYSGTWTYDPKGADTQQIAVISIDTLYANVQKLGISAQPQQGFHFKMFCYIGNHSKMKEFWVAAPTAPLVNPTPSPTQGPSGGVAAETGSRIGLAETGGPVLGLGLLLMLVGGFTWLTSAVARRRS